MSAEKLGALVVRLQAELAMLNKRFEDKLRGEVLN
jgi:hypothetical protein